MKKFDLFLGVFEICVFLAVWGTAIWNACHQIELTYDPFSATCRCVAGFYAGVAVTNGVSRLSRLKKWN